jgi:hypothetical protein
VMQLTKSRGNTPPALWVIRCVRQYGTGGSGTECRRIPKSESRGEKPPLMVPRMAALWTQRKESQ